MLKRIASTGVNLVVLGVSVGIFLVAFVALNALGAAQKPPTVSVLSARRDLNIGDVFTAEDLAVKTVFQDDNAALYIPGDEVTGVVDGIVAQPIFSGQPVFRSSIVAQAAERTRLSAVLAKYPGYSLFPLPLDAMNLVAPGVEAFLPGDLVGVTVVIASQPQQMNTPTTMPELIMEGVESTATALPQEAEQTDALSRALPPLAKDLFPLGVRVISVQGIARYSYQMSCYYEAVKALFGQSTQIDIYFLDDMGNLNIIGVQPLQLFPYCSGPQKLALTQL